MWDPALACGLPSYQWIASPCLSFPHFLIQEQHVPLQGHIIEHGAQNKYLSHLFSVVLIRCHLEKCKHWKSTPSEFQNHVHNHACPPMCHTVSFYGTGEVNPIENHEMKSQGCLQGRGNQLLPVCELKPTKQLPDDHSLPKRQ